MSTYKKHILLSLFLTCMFLLKLNAQPNSYQLFQNILPAPEVSAIECFLQDAQGLIWMGTDRGLYSYNGYSSHQHFITDSIENARIHTGIFVSPNQLYLGSDRGIFIYNTETDCYETLTSEFPKNIRSLALHDNDLWIGTLEGLYVYSFTTKQIHSFNEDVTSGLSHPAIYSILVADDIYIGTYNGLCKYITTQRKFVPINLPKRTAKNNQFINALLNDTINQCIWIGLEGELLQYFPQNNQVNVITPFNNQSVKSLAFDKDHQLLIGTDNGMYVYHVDGALAHISHDSRNQQSLVNNIVWSVFTDREGNSWIGTDHGASLAKNNISLNFTPISQLTGTGEGNQFHALYKDSKGVYWFGGTNGLLKFDAKVGDKNRAEWFKMNGDEYTIAHNRIRDIYEDKDSDIWITTDGGVHRFNRKDNRFSAYNITDKSGTYNANWAYQILEDNKQQMWIASYMGGIFMIDKNKLTDSSKHYIADSHLSIENGLADLNVNQMVADHNGNLWALYYSKTLQKINPETGEITTLNLPHQTLNTLLCDAQGKLWGAYRGGVVCIDPITLSIDEVLTGPFTTQSVLAMDEVDNEIWISTTDGINVVDKQTREIKRLSLSDMQYTSLFYAVDERKVYLGGVDGYATTTPSALQQSSLDRPIILTDLLINNVSTLQHGESIRYTRKINLKHTENNIGICYSDLPYSLEKKNLFVYKLIGLDENWNVLPGNLNQIQYNNLLPGDYQLVVCKLGSDGMPSDNQYELDIHITPPWYASMPAKAIYALTLLGVIVWTISFFRMRNRLKYEQKEKEQILEQSRQKMEFLANLSHDIKTPLSLVIAPISKMLTEIKSGKDKRVLEDVQRNAIKLNALIHQVVDINRIDNKANNLLILSHTEMVGFVQSIAVGYASIAAERNIKFSFTSDQDQIYANIDIIKWESIIGNLLSNAFKYTADGGTISVVLKNEAEQLTVTVTDSGIGIPQQDLPYIFQRFFQSSATKGKKEGTGIGLYLVKTYTEMHGGQVYIESEEHKGTSLTLSLPITQEEANTSENLIASEPNIMEDETNIGAANDEMFKEKLPLIVIVEDNVEVSELIASILDAHYRYKVAHNGKEGIELINELHPDLILTDYVMPIMDGMEMARHIRKNVPTSTIPIILLTGKDDKQTELESIRQQIDAFITKPFDHDLLLSRISQLLNIKETIQTQTRLEILQTPQAIEAVSYDEQFLADITAIIEEHIDDSNLNVNALSTISNINTKQLYRKLKQLTGETPVDYIKSIRMKKAAMLLEQRKFTVAEVMYMVGFSSHSYFSKCFQAKFSKTPKQFMEEKDIKNI